MAIKKGGFMRGKGEVLVISDGTGFFLWLIWLDWVVSWERDEEGEGTWQGRFCFGREGREEDDFGSEGRKFVWR